MELKVGMYVTDLKRLEVGKIINFCDCEYCKERGFEEPIIDNQNIFITNYDKKCGFHGYRFYEKLIDLIEVGDYVNGVRVENIIGCLLGFDGGQDGNWYIENEEDIKSIVTKEQFENMSYKVGDK